MWVLLRLIIGTIFLLSGLTKLLSPYQNFLYAIQAYQLLPSALEVAVAQIFPWIELLVGAFLFLGLWTRWALAAACVLFGLFVVVVGQALIRGFALDHCGCFGGAIDLNPKTMIVLDSVGLLVTSLLLKYCARTEKFSFDSHFK